MKLHELWTPPYSEIVPNKKTEKLRNIFKKKGPVKKKRIRAVALGKDKTWVPDPDKLDFLKGHTDNGPKFS